ncbi:MAG: cysteine desulfurase, partial [Erysipelotrichaceae bacterium]|nr:cysteine desulfurase [Erysipelotrichaceae bacterium]
MELYLDNAATSKIDLDVLDEYYKLLKTYFASTGSLHSLGEEVLTLENKSKEKIAKLLKVKPNEILFNSGATEGNNYAIKGVAFKYKNRGNTIITSKVEHPSVLKCFEQLEKEYNFNCIYLDVNENGIIDLNELKKHLSNDVILVSIMYVNHEVGTIMPIKQISSLLKEYPKIIFHSDITQAIGKVDIDLSSVDIATMSAHKIHGIKGSGFMYKKEKIELFPLISGHNANNAMRAGTSNWPSNVVMSKALENSLNFLKENDEKMRLCQKKLISSLKNIASVVVNTNLDYCISSIVNFSLPG